MEKILVSSCLLGNNTKYDGGNNLNKKLVKDLEGFEIIPICPEVDGGLSIPRDPSENVGDKVFMINGEDVTNNFSKGALIALSIALEQDIKYAILKARSPSCGSGEIYDGTFSHTLVKGDGVTASLLKKSGVEVYNEVNYVELLKKLTK